MNEYSWTKTRARAIDLFNAGPNAEREAATLEAFTNYPRLVTEAIEKIGVGVKNGTIRSGWAVLCSQLRSLTNPAADLIVSDSIGQDKALTAAKAWIRNAGIHCDRESELEDALFGDLGPLRHYDTPQLRHEMLDLWKRLRPDAIRSEQEAEARAEEWKRVIGRPRIAKLQKEHALELGLTAAAEDEAA